MRQDVDVVQDPDFTTCKVFTAQCVFLKKIGMAKVTHKPPISSEDMAKLYQCFVVSLQNSEIFTKKSFFSVLPTEKVILL